MQNLINELSDRFRFDCISNNAQITICPKGISDVRIHGTVCGTRVGRDGRGETDEKWFRLCVQFVNQHASPFKGQALETLYNLVENVDTDIFVEDNKTWITVKADAVRIEIDALPIQATLELLARQIDVSLHDDIQQAIRNAAGYHGEEEGSAVSEYLLNSVL